MIFFISKYSLILILFTIKKYLRSGFSLQTLFIGHLKCPFSVKTLQTPKPTDREKMGPVTKIENIKTDLTKILIFQGQKILRPTDYFSVLFSEFFFSNPISRS